MQTRAFILVGKSSETGRIALALSTGLIGDESADAGTSQKRKDEMVVMVVMRLSKRGL